MHNLLIIDDLSEAGIALLEENPEVSYRIFDALEPSKLLQAVADADAVILNDQTPFDRKLLKAAKKLKVIGRTSVRVSDIDVEAATQKGVMVINTPQTNTISAAEHTMALMLAACRHLPQAHFAMQQGNLSPKAWQGIEIYGKTLGLIGLGNVGRLVAERAKAFGMSVIAYDPYVSELIGRDLGVTLVDFADLLSESDIISLHPIVTEETIELINSDAVEHMKNGAILVNVASGRLIDPDAVADGLRSGKLAGVAMDGPFGSKPEDNPFINLPNAISTPSLATQSEEAKSAVSAEIVRNVLGVLQGTAYRNVINIAWPKDAELKKIQPYTDLARTIGKLQMQLAPAVIERIEIQISGDDMQPLVRPMAAGLLTGLLSAEKQTINHVNAPYVAKQKGLIISQEYDMEEADYSNLISCRVQWRDDSGALGSRLISGVLFGGREPRIVQVDEYRIEAKPEGIMLVLRNKDIPGVIGQVATLLATYQVNIAEWRLGREAPGGEALSFINLDGEPPDGVMHALGQAPAVTSVQLVRLHAN